MTRIPDDLLECGAHWVDAVRTFTDPNAVHLAGVEVRALEAFRQAQDRWAAMHSTRG